MFNVFCCTLVAKEEASSFVVNSCHGWRPPEEGLLKVSVVGSFSDKNGSAGFGDVVRDYVGLLVDNFVGLVKAGFSFTTEAHAIRWINIMIVAKGCMEVMIVIVCKDLVEVSNGMGMVVFGDVIVLWCFSCLFDRCIEVSVLV